MGKFQGRHPLANPLSLPSQSAELNQLRDFLDLSVGQVYAPHKASFTPAYRKSIKEVMDTDGPIPDEYWEGLDKLRERLVLSPEVSQSRLLIPALCRSPAHES
jgi:hypothetical protein